MRTKRYIAGLLTMLIALTTSPVAFANNASDTASPPVLAPQEAEARTTYVLNVLKFVRWPEASTQSSNFIFCVLGSNPFGGVLESLSGKAVDSRPVRVVSGISPEFARYCHAVFIGASEAQVMPTVIRDLKGSAALTISDVPGFVKYGGMVELYASADNKLGLSVNQQNAEAEGLRISSKLLTLSK